MRTRKLGLGTRVPAREHVMVDEAVFNYFHRRLREIEREWRAGLSVEAAETPGIFETISACVGAARDELRAEVRGHAKTYPGEFLVPV